MRRPLLAIAAAAAAVLQPRPAAAQVPNGVEFRVNSYTTLTQSQPSVAGLGNGEFVVVWESLQGAGFTFDVLAKRYSSNGVPIGSEFEVPSYTSEDQGSPVVAAHENGDFVVVWDRPDYPVFNTGQTSIGVFARRFASDATPIGTDFQVNTYTTDFQRYPSVATQPDGEFVVVWHSKGQDGGDYGVFGQRFASSGDKTGTEFQVNTSTAGKQFRQRIAAEPGGDFVVVWSGDNPATPDYEIYGQRFAGSGTRLGSEFRVNTYTTANQRDPSVAAQANGDFLVVWSDYGSPPPFGTIFAQRFTSSGTPLGSQFRVNTYTTFSQIDPEIASDSNDGFVVVWISSTQDGDGFGVFGQRLSSSGALAGGEFRVSSYTTGSLYRPEVATIDAESSFVVVWEGGFPTEQDGDSAGVFGQRFTVPDLIFEDGFESGSFSAWDASNTDGGDLSVTGAAALASTSLGMQALGYDTNGIDVTDESPNAESRYRARFYFDPNGFDPGEAQGRLRVRLMIAFDSSSQRLVTNYRPTLA